MRLIQRITSFLCVFLTFSLCSIPADPSTQGLSVEVLGYKPKILAPGIISKSSFEGHASITPDGREIYYAVYTLDLRFSLIALSSRTDVTWTEPLVAPFSGRFSDGSPALSPDGNRLFFSSNRPVAEGPTNDDNDLWMVERSADDSWGQPVWLGDAINSSFNEFSPTVDSKGNLYFCSDRPGGYGDMDVYLSKFLDQNYQAPVLLSDSVNSIYHEGNVGVSPDGKLLLVMVQNKPGDFGHDDIHFSFRREGEWSALKNAGPMINTYAHDFSPKVSPDGSLLYFASRVSNPYDPVGRPLTFQSFQSILQSPLNGLANIYVIDMDIILSEKDNQQ